VTTADLLTTAQAAAALGLKPSTVRDHAAAGLLRPSARYPRLLLFAPEEVARYQRERRRPGQYERVGHRAE